jgi:hypothetical protein
LRNPYKTDIKNLLREYVFIRSEVLNPAISGQGLQRLEELQEQIWKLAVSVAEKNPNSVVAGLFIQSVNHVFELYVKQMNIENVSRIPIIVWTILYFVAVLAIGSLGYQFGLTRSGHTTISLLLIVAFASVIMLIADLDRPQEGFIKVSEQSLIDLMNKLY